MPSAVGAYNEDVESNHLAVTTVQVEAASSDAAARASLLRALQDEGVLRIAGPQETGRLDSVVRAMLGAPENEGPALFLVGASSIGEVLDAYGGRSRPGTGFLFIPGRSDALSSAHIPSTFPLRGFLAAPADKGTLFVSIVRSVAESLAFEFSCQAELRRLRAAVGAIPDLMLLFDDELRFLEVMTGDERLLYRRADELVGRTVFEVLERGLAEQVAAVIGEACMGGRPPSIEYKLDTVSGPRWFEGRAAPAGRSASGRRQAVFIARDIGERKKLEEELLSAASRDPLTGALNRRAGMEELERESSLATRRGASLAVCFADIDGLKSVNDSCGHAVGDELIVRASLAISAALRRTDTLCRFGGDEFLVILPDCGEVEAEALRRRIGSFTVAGSIPERASPSPDAAGNGDRSAEPSRAAARPRARPRNHSLPQTKGVGASVPRGTRAPVPPLSISMGFAFSLPFHRLDSESLISMADAEMYLEKASRKAQKQ